MIAFVLAGLSFIASWVLGVILITGAVVYGVVMWTPLRGYLGISPHHTEQSRLPVPFADPLATMRERLRQFATELQGLLDVPDTALARYRNEPSRDGR